MTPFDTSVLIEGLCSPKCWAAALRRIIAQGREIDLGIAACAIVKNADPWTLNKADFRDSLSFE